VADAARSRSWWSSVDSALCTFCAHVVWISFEVRQGMVFRAKASHWLLSGADDDGAFVRRFPSWGLVGEHHSPHTAMVIASPGENPNSVGVGGGGGYVAIFLKTPSWSA
jgi:hypothetical protein